MAAEISWEKFESKLKSIVPSLESQIFVKIKGSFMDIHVSVLLSQDFKNFIKSTLDSYSEDSSNIYKKLLLFKNDLKGWKKRKRKINLEACESPAKVFVKEEKALVEEEMKLKEQIEKKAEEDAKIAKAIEEEEAINNANRLREFNIFEAFNFSSTVNKDDANKTNKKKTVAKNSETPIVDKSVVNKIPNKKIKKPQIKPLNKSSKKSNTIKGKTISKPTETKKVKEKQANQSDNIKPKTEPTPPTIHILPETSKETQISKSTTKPKNNDYQIIIDDDVQIKKTNSVISEKIQKRIDKLEKLLSSTQYEIKKREEEEMDLDELDDECSSYIHLDKLKAHCVKIWRSIDKLKKEKSDVENKYYKKFTYDEMPHKELNKRIERFVRKKRFPDYYDILKLVQNYATEKRVPMSTQKIAQYAQEIFLGVGNKLKKLRINDFEKNFGNHLTDQVRITEDPMLKDENLRRTLTKNLYEGRTKLDKIIKEYFLLQTNLEEENLQDSEHESVIATDTDEEELDKVEEDEESEEEEEEEEEDIDEKTLVDDNDNDDIGETTNKNKEILPVEEIPCPTEGNRLLTDDFFANEPEYIVDEESRINYVPTTNIKSDEIEELKREDDEIDEKEKEASTNNNNNIVKEIIEIFDSTPAPKPVKILAEIIPEDTLKILKKHTFQFNFDQLEKRENSRYYSEVVTIDDDDDDESKCESLSSDDDSSSSTNSGTKKNGDIKERENIVYGNGIEEIKVQPTINSKQEAEINGTYSSKVDKIIYPKKKKEDIFITLEDSDEEPGVQTID